ncbi:hypothetical protein GCM10023148_01360 [Actinokineospora soli]
MGTNAGIDPVLGTPVTGDMPGQAHHLTPDIKTLPFVDRRFLAQDPYLAPDGRVEANMVGARGCRADCSFCGAAVSANPDITIRSRDPRNIITGMRQLRATGVEAFRFVDHIPARSARASSNTAPTPAPPTGTASSPPAATPPTNSSTTNPSTSPATASTTPCAAATNSTSPPTSPSPTPPSPTSATASPTSPKPNTRARDPPDPNLVRTPDPPWRIAEHLPALGRPLRKVPG